MEKLLNNAQVTLESAITQYLSACTALHAPLPVVPDETSRLNAISLIEKYHSFINSNIERLSKTAVALCKTRNQYLQTHRLPPELLANILSLSIDRHTYFPSLTSRVPSPVSQAVSLSSVCSHWRNLIVGTSSFWSLIYIHWSESIVATCLERTQNLPLDVVAKEPIFNTGRIWKGQRALVPHFHHVRSLNMRADSDSFYDWMLYWMTVPKTPCCLKELSLNSLNTRQWPSGLLSPFMKQLHTLSFYNIKTYWTECRFDSLCVLKLGGISELGTTDIAHIVATSPKLQIIEFTGVDLGNSELEPGYKPINAPSLKTLRLRDLTSPDLCAILDVFSTTVYDLELDIVQRFFLGLHLSDERALSESTAVSMFQDKINQHKIRNITYLKLTGPVPRKLLSTFGTQPKLTSLRLEQVGLARHRLGLIESATEAFPQMKTIQMRNVRIEDVDGFKALIQGCSVERIELACCRSVQDGKKTEIEPGMIDGWNLKPGLKISTLEE